jgi:cholesterol oxidase
MGNSPEQGVVDSNGEVFGYPGFFIADGSVMPGPVGPNPSLTIAALADHFAEKVIENYQHQHLRIDRIDAVPNHK